MPVMNGIEATHQLRENGCPSKIIALTGNAQVEDKEAFLEAGADEFVGKPASLKKLQNAFSNVMRTRVVEDMSGKDMKVDEKRDD